MSFLLFFVPFMVSSGIGRLEDSGCPALLGGGEVALGVAITAGSVKEIRDARAKRRTGESSSREAKPSSDSQLRD
ncbi:hypothetical protein ACIPSE_32435 [Streptomyces sp. NPDC090106]|uniref:hypothetical protein n=1 Tax=Streptomyces sp. NPDC090106 TaxID=3365946 RepID=UPI003802F40E